MNTKNKIVNIFTFLTQKYRNYFQIVNSKILLRNNLLLMETFADVVGLMCKTVRRDQLGPDALEPPLFKIVPVHDLDLLPEP
jgi:hypothetical protein